VEEKMSIEKEYLAAECEVDYDDALSDHDLEIIEAF
jgi:hypothetical protein